jgi:ABC-type dipeptide/oligopeptide/nickel transport system permease subunit
MPHLLPSVLVNITFGVGTAILMESALSFIGLGIQPPAASWEHAHQRAELSVLVSLARSVPWHIDPHDGRGDQRSR